MYMSLYCTRTRLLSRVVGAGARYIGVYVTRGQLFYGTCAKQQHAAINVSSALYPPFNINYALSNIQANKRTTVTIMDIALNGFHSLLHVYTARLRSKCMLKQNATQQSHEYASLALMFHTPHEYLSIMGAYQYVYNNVHICIIIILSKIWFVCL